MTEYQRFERWYEKTVSAAADSWNSQASRLACSGLFPPFYLYYRPSKGSEAGALYIVPDGSPTDETWQLGSPEPFRANLERRHVRARIWDAARRLPICAV
jgi:hypothetical protein